MSIASLVLGIISAIVALVPGCGYIAAIPALVGLILGIVFVVKNKEGKKGLAIAGIVLNVIAVVILIGYTMLFASAAKDPEFMNLMNEINAEYHNSLSNYNYAE